MIRCTKEECDKEAIYIVDGQSVCKEHKEDKGSMSSGDRLIGRF